MLTNAFQNPLASIGSHVQLSNLVRNFAISAPKVKRKTPSWSLNLVLSYLKKAEPLDSLSLKRLTIKCKGWFYRMSRTGSPGVQRWRGSIKKKRKILPVQFPNSNSIQFLTLYVISFLLFYFNFGSVAALVSSMDGSGQTVKGHWWCYGGPRVMHMNIVS